MKIWGRANSINVQKVLWTADECGLKYERIDVGGAFGGNDKPWYLKMNPNGIVPTIDDGGRVIWESNSCVRYLAAKYAAGTLWPNDPGQRSEADRWMDWQLSVIARGMGIIFWGLIRTAPDKRDMKAIDEAVAETGQLWARLDGHLADRPYVAGGHLTMGDIPAGCMAYRWFALDIKRPELKNLRAWHDRLATRPGYAQHIMIKMT
ncbi:MAG: glutathione S-transferase family protein [Reyranella sp.]|nr:MAG: glutathione S-transferase family protein [Reyranella sp.]